MERLTLLSQLPQSDSIDRLLIRKELVGLIEITKVEADEIGLKEENGMVQWNLEKAKEKTIVISESTKNYITSILKELSDTKKLTVQSVDLYTKIVK